MVDKLMVTNMEEWSRYFLQVQVDGAKRYVGGVFRHKKEFECILIGGTINYI